MGRRFFGTDGVRGVANQKLTPEFALSLGLAVGSWIRENGKHRRVIIGRDTRLSGSMLGAALSSGLCSMGVNVDTLGVAPTPTVSFAARSGEYDIGVIISASHNPAPDNGIKFVTHLGTKSTDSMEEEWESLMARGAETRASGGDLGKVEPAQGVIERYEAFLEEIVPERLDGVKIAVDCAHGAAYAIAPEVLRRLGADVVLMGAEPNGMNINAEGGATKPESIHRFTQETGSDIGVAFDGDADRAIFSDEKGRLINGDRTIGIWAGHYQTLGELRPAVVVGTVMSNGGFEAFLRSRGIELARTPVGDKHVSQKISETGALIGGEQSGHIIFPRRGPTGDGLATMLELLRVLKLEGRPASSFVADYEPWPQLMVNVHVQTTDAWNEHPRVASALSEGEERLKGRGRLVVRPSGTQPVIRVMVEADEFDLRDEVAESIVTAMESDLGGEVHGRVDLTHALGD